jgi:membrane protein DedA with SNARE-associated domain
MKESLKKTSVILLLALTTMGIFAQDSIPAKDLSVIQRVEQWYEQNMNYYTITLLMTVESSFIPFPSEIVIPPAAFIASKEGSDLNIFLVVLFGTLGALLGAYINYALAYYLGRPILHKFADSKIGRLMLLSSEKIQTAENYFQTHGKTSTFVGRLIPAIRQLISVPAGLSKMNLLSFTLFTFLGAGLWNAVLALLGYIAQGQADLIDLYSHEIGYGILGVILLIAAFYLLKYLRKRNKK